MADRLQVFFLESSWQLGTVMAAAAIGCLAVWRRRPTTLTFRLMIGVVAAGLVLLVIQKLVVTDREKITTALHAMAAAVDEGDVDTLGSFISDSLTRFSASALVREGTDKEEFLQEATRWLERNSVDNVALDSMAVVVNEDVATAAFRARARVQADEYVWPLAFSRWELRFQRDADDQWRVIQVRGKSVESENLIDRFR